MARPCTHNARPLFHAGVAIVTRRCAHCHAISSRRPAPFGYHSPPNFLGLFICACRRVQCDRSINIHIVSKAATLSIDTTTTAIRRRTEELQEGDEMCLAPPAAAMATEELQEGEELCPDYYNSSDDGRGQRRLQQPHRWSGRKPCCLRTDDENAACKVRRPGSLSAPVAIVVPVTAVTTTMEDDDDDEAAFVPPHVALEARRRRSEGRVASSMCEGLGRTLKGRDLQFVRTAVLRMTGFIESCPVLMRTELHAYAYPRSPPACKMQCNQDVVASNSHKVHR